MRNAHVTHPRTSSKSGATLAEVLIALLIMGIGVVAAASMFPIAILRTIQATQLTNATNLRFNAEAMIGVDPRLVRDPNFMNGTGEHDGQLYVVDPMGFHSVSAPASQNTFGNDGTGAFGSVTRFSAGTADIAAARILAMLPDSWIEQTTGPPDATAGNTTPISVVLDPAEFDLANIAVTALDPPARVLLLHTNGRLSQTRDIAVGGINAGTGQITWTGNLPPEFVDDTNGNGTIDPGESNIEQVRVETQDERYTWLLTVQNNVVGGTGTVNVSVVVFFRRNFNPANERIYSNVSRQGSRNTYRINYGSGEPPFAKSGSFLFDPVAAQWYRIQKAVDNPAGNYVDVTLARDTVNGDSLTDVMLMPGVVDVFPIGNF